MTIGAHEVTTVDELQHLILLGGGDGEGLHELCSCEATTGAHEVMTTGPYAGGVQVSSTETPSQINDIHIKPQF